MFATTTYGRQKMITDNFGFKIKQDSNPKVSCVWPTLEIPTSIKLWCRENAVSIGMDAYMRYQFKGRRSAIEKLINDHIAPDRPELRRQVTGTIIEA